MKYLEALEDFNPVSGCESVFLAGGITGCPDWQQEIRQLLGSTDLLLLNPRHTDFDISNPNIAEQQISWEYNHLRYADIILFWFCKEMIQPIALYELGTWSVMDKPLFIGVHFEYKRRQDIEIQIEFVRPEIEIVYSLQELANQVKGYSNGL